MIELLKAVFEFVRLLVELVFPMDYGMSDYMTTAGVLGFMAGAGVHVVINLDKDTDSKKKLLKKWFIVSAIASFVSRGLYQIVYPNSGLTRLSLFVYSITILACAFVFFGSFSFLFFLLFRMTGKKNHTGRKNDDIEDAGANERSIAQEDKGNDEL